MLNPSLLAAADAVMANNPPSQFAVSAKFFSSAAGSTSDFYPFRIDTIDYIRDYESNYSDVIDIGFKISGKDYAILQDQGQNLLCLLTLTYMDQYGVLATTPPPVSKQYNVMINDPRDIRAGVPDIHVYVEPNIPISLRLIESTVYNLRQTKINAIYPNVTVTQVIYALAATFGIKNIHLVPPDNTHVYDHITIASHQGIESAFITLQAQCGVYQKGMNHYITDGVLYIYPPFDTAPAYDRTAIFYQVDKGRYSGNNTFHMLGTSSISIVVNTQPHSFDLSIAGAENVGTGFIFLKSSRLTDGITTIDSSKGAQFTDSPGMSVSLASNRTVIQNQNNMVHIQSTDNPYPKMSEIIAHQASLMEVGWREADPFQMDPPQAIVYNYDQNGTMVKKTGILSKASYRISNMGKIGVFDRFGCVGVLTLRLSPNVTTVI